MNRLIGVAGTVGNKVGERALKLTSVTALAALVACGGGGHETHAVTPDTTAPVVTPDTTNVRSQMVDASGIANFTVGINTNEPTNTTLPTLPTGWTHTTALSSTNSSGAESKSYGIRFDATTPSATYGSVSLNFVSTDRAGNATTTPVVLSAYPSNIVSRAIVPGVSISNGNPNTGVFMTDSYLSDGVEYLAPNSLSARFHFTITLPRVQNLDGAPMQPTIDISGAESLTPLAIDPALAGPVPTWKSPVVTMNGDGTSTVAIQLEHEFSVLIYNNPSIVKLPIKITYEDGASFTHLVQMKVIL